MAQSTERKISCRRCQTRKIKCSRTAPCTKCLSAGVRCEYRDFDSKRTPISREYVATLEGRVASLESLLAVTQERSGKRYLGSRPGRRDQGQSMLPKPCEPSIRNDVSLARPPFPSFRSSLLLQTHRRKDLQHIPDDCESNEDISIEPDLLDSLNSFMRWQNPSLMLFDSLDSVLSSKSYALVYAVAALGALTSSSLTVRQRAIEFFQLSEDSLVISKLKHDTYYVEACLLCSMFQAGQGELAKSQAYYDLAMSATRELMQQRRRFPSLTLADIRGTSDGDDPRLRRMLLNLYKSDKILKLFLGPSALPIEGVTQDILEMARVKTSPAASPGALKHLELFKLTQDILNLTNDLPDISCTAGVSLTQLNSKLCGWHEDLPIELRWNKWGSSSDVVDPKVASMHMLYHTARLSMNQHFQQSLEADLSYDRSTSFNICTTSIDLIVSILQRYKAQYTLQSCPLIFVHGTMTACEILISLANQQCFLSSTDEAQLSTLGVALEEFSHSWAIAEQARVGLHELIRDFYACQADIWRIPESDSGLSDSLSTPSEQLDWVDATILEEPVGVAANVFNQDDMLELQGSFYGHSNHWTSGLMDFNLSQCPNAQQEIGEELLNCYAS